MKRFILILLTCAMLVGCLASCNILDPQPNAQPEPEGPATNEPIDYTKEDDTPNMTISYDMSLVADLYLSLDGAEESEKIYLDQLDGKLTVGEIVFDQVSYGENVEVKFEGAYTCSEPQISVEYNGTVSGTEDEKAILTVMARIIQQKNCYLLESSTDNEIAEYIAAYYFDGVCYLVLLNENGVAFSVYSMEVEYAELPLTDGLSFVAETFAMWRMLSSGDYCRIDVIDNEIYYFDDPCEVTYYNGVKINIDWCQDNVHGLAKYDNTTIMNILNKINNENGCFVIKRIGDDYHKKLAVYCFDNVYYFVDITDTYRDRVWISRMYCYSEAE